MPALKETPDPALRRAEHAAVVAERRSELYDTCGRLLAGAGEFVWEVGSGHGHFLAAYGAAHPERLCLGVDLVAERVARAQRKRERARLGRVHFLRGEAGDFLAALPAHARMAAIFILFPDPWPKRRHHKHRLLTPAFLGAVAARAGEGARLHFRTDDEACFAAARATLEAHPSWRLVDEPWPFEAETVFQARAPSYRSLIAARSGSP